MLNKGILLGGRVSFVNDNEPSTLKYTLDRVSILEILKDYIMTPKEYPKRIERLLDKIKEKEHDSVLKERELEPKDCLFNGFTTNRQEPMIIRKDLLYGYCYPPYKDVLGNWIVYS